MNLPRSFLQIFSVGAFMLSAHMTHSATAQDYPNKPVRLVTTGVGSAADFAARLIAQGIAGPLGQQVIVDNRASGVIPGEIVSKAPPEGYTLLVAGSTLWIGPLLRKTPFDPVRDFAPITLASGTPNIIVVHPSVQVNSVKDLIALAKAKPGALSYASATAGATSHLAGELFKTMAGVDIVNIPYKSGAAQMADLIGGQVQLSFATAASVATHIKSGRLKALAVTSPQPSTLAPGLPTVAASGLPGYEMVTITGIFAPARTPAPLIGRLNHEMVRFLKSPEAKENFFSAGMETIGSSPEELGAKIKSVMASLGKVIKDAGIHVD